MPDWLIQSMLPGSLLLLWVASVIAGRMEERDRG